MSNDDVYGCGSTVWSGRQRQKQKVKRRNIMKKLMVMLAVIGLYASSAWASGIGAYGAYWKTKGGSEAFDGDGFGGGAKIKMDLVPELSIEVRGTYFSLKQKVDDVDVGGTLEVIPVEAGLTLNIPNRSKCTPYIGGGVGYFFMNAKSDDGESHSLDSVLGGYGIVGLEFELAEGLCFFAEGKYTVVSAQDKDEGSPKIKLDGFGASAGLMLKF